MALHAGGIQGDNFSSATPTASEQAAAATTSSLRGGSSEPTSSAVPSSSSGLLSRRPTDAYAGASAGDRHEQLLEALAATAALPDVTVGGWRSHAGACTCGGLVARSGGHAPPHAGCCSWTPGLTACVRCWRLRPALASGALPLHAACWRASRACATATRQAPLRWSRSC